MHRRATGWIWYTLVILATAALLLSATFLDPLPSGVPIDPLLFELRWLGAAVLGVAARVLSFRVYGRARLTVDSPVYIAVAFQLGVLSAAWLMFAVLGSEAFIRTMRAVSRPRRPSIWKVGLERTFLASVPVVLMLMLGALFRLDTLARPLDLTALLVMVPAFSASFLALHYFATGSILWFDGSPSRSLLREYLFQ